MKKPLYFHILFTLLVFFTLPLSAQNDAPRKWTDTTGTKSFVGTYISYADGLVTIDQGSRTIKFPIERLNKKDQQWLRAQRDRESNKEQGPRSVFDSLQFGDTQRDVLAKLKESQIVISNVGNGIFDGLTGIDEKFKTKNAIGDLQCFLYFKWLAGDDPALGKIKVLAGLELRSDSVPKEQYSSVLQNSWNEMVKLFGIIYGEPLSQATYPEVYLVEQSGGIINTHRWQIPGANIKLGPAYNYRTKSYYLHVIISKN